MAGDKLMIVDCVNGGIYRRMPTYESSTYFTKIIRMHHCSPLSTRPHNISKVEISVETSQTFTFCLSDRLRRRNTANLLQKTLIFFEQGIDLVLTIFFLLLISLNQECKFLLPL